MKFLSLQQCPKDVTSLSHNTPHTPHTQGLVYGVQICLAFLPVKNMNTNIDTNYFLLQNGMHDVQHKCSSLLKHTHKRHKRLCPSLLKNTPWRLQGMPGLVTQVTCMLHGILGPVTQVTGKDVAGNAGFAHTSVPAHINKHTRNRLLFRNGILNIHKCLGITEVGPHRHK